MARKKKMKRTRKSLKMANDTELTFPLVATDGTGAGLAVVATDQQLAVMNMRLYRQSMSYTVKFSAPAPNSGTRTTYKFFTLANNWFTLGAIKHAFRNWRFSIQDELQNAAPGKWHDFRLADTNLDGDNARMLANSFDGDSYNALETGEYQYSISSIDDGTDKTFGLFGDLADQYNIFDEYAKHLDAQHPADETVGGATTTYNNLHDADASVMGHLATGFDTPPYPRNLDGGNWADAVLIERASISVDPDGAIGPMSTPYFDAPLGLVFCYKLVAGSGTDFATDTPEVLLHVKPGSYKGVDAKPILRFPKDLRLATAKSNR